MIRLQLQRAPVWLDLALGVSVLVAPMTTAIYMAALRDDLVASLPPDAEASTRLVALNKAMAVRVIQEWRGVGDADGSPLLPSRETVSALFDLKDFFEAFNDRYFAPWYLVTDEKKGSAPLPNGTSAGAPNTAPLVQPVVTAVRAAKTSRKRKTG